jgi:hypothetical protein
MNKYFRFALFPNFVRPVLEKEALILKFQSETPRLRSPPPELISQRDIVQV